MAKSKQRSVSVPPKFKYYAPDFTQPSINESLVFEFLPKEIIMEDIHDYHLMKTKQKAKYKLFPNEIADFYHSMQDQPSEDTLIIRGSYHFNVKKWHKKNQLHRDSVNCPAYIEESNACSVQRFYKDGKLHRELDYPADVVWDKINQVQVYQYFWNGMKHRWNGPAMLFMKLDNETNILESNNSFWWFGQSCNSIQEFCEAKFNYETEKTINFSILNDVVVDHIEWSLKLNSNNQSYYIIPVEIVNNIIKYCFH